VVELAIIMMDKLSTRMPGNYIVLWEACGMAGHLARLGSRGSDRRWEQALRSWRRAR
jgi:hypothetical protein